MDSGGAAHWPSTAVPWATSPAKANMMIRWAKFDTVCSYGSGAMSEAHLGGSRAMAVIERRCAMVASFPWASAVSGTQSGGPPTSILAQNVMGRSPATRRGDVVL
jgi:hypothetical protein